jgi:hypothetical protein
MCICPAYKGFTLLSFIIFRIGCCIACLQCLVCSGYSFIAGIPVKFRGILVVILNVFEHVGVCIGSVYSSCSFIIGII